MPQLPMVSGSHPRGPRSQRSREGTMGSGAREADGQPPEEGPGTPRVTVRPRSVPALAGSGARAQPSIWWLAVSRGRQPC